MWQEEYSSEEYPAAFCNCTMGLFLGTDCLHLVFQSKSGLQAKVCHLQMFPCSLTMKWGIHVFIHVYAQKIMLRLLMK